MMEEAGSITKMIAEIKRKNFEMMMNMTDEEWSEHCKKINEEQKKEFKNLRFISNISEL